jgi:peroxiredoxin
VQSIAAFLRERSVQVLVVTFTPPATIAAYLARRPLPLPIVSDPGREAYRAFGLKRTNAFAFFKPRVLGKFIRQILQGGRVQRPVDKDVLQLGGDFLFDADGRLVWSWRSQDATDRPTPADICTAVKALNPFFA